MSAKLAPLMSSAKQDWETPEHVLDLVRKVAGPIALDVATSPDNPTNADRIFTEADDGLAQTWMAPVGRTIWMNPPYNALKAWAARWADAAGAAGDLCHYLALTPARTDTQWFRSMRLASDSVCFVEGRLTFKGAPSCAPFPSAIFYAGPTAHVFADVFRDLGWTVRP